MQHDPTTCLRPRHRLHTCAYSHIYVATRRSTHPGSITSVPSLHDSIQHTLNVTPTPSNDVSPTPFEAPKENPVAPSLHHRPPRPQNLTQYIPSDGLAMDQNMINGFCPTTSPRPSCTNTMTSSLSNRYLNLTITNPTIAQRMSSMETLQRSVFLLSPQILELLNLKLTLWISPSLSYGNPERRSLLIMEPHIIAYLLSLSRKHVITLMLKLHRLHNNEHCRPFRTTPKLDNSPPMKLV